MLGEITDSPYDESDHVVFERSGRIDHLGQSVARRCLRYELVSETATGRCSANFRSAAAAPRIESAASRAPIGPAIAIEADEHIDLGHMAFQGDLNPPAKNGSDDRRPPGSAERGGVRWVHPAQKPCQPNDRWMVNLASSSA